MFPSPLQPLCYLGMFPGPLQPFYYLGMFPGPLQPFSVLFEPELLAEGAAGADQRIVYE